MRNLREIADAQPLHDPLREVIEIFSQVLQEHEKEMDDMQAKVDELETLVRNQTPS